jgi:hypothetical protein
LSPTDRVYGGSESNRVDEMIKKMQTFDVLPAAKWDVRFTIVAPHLNTVLPIMDKIVASGFLLSQIRLFYRPNSKSAAMVYNYVDDSIDVRWKLIDENQSTASNDMAGSRNLGSVMQRIVGEFP